MFRPRIIGFVCNWSLPMEVDLESASIVHGYPKMHVVRVMCVGRIDPAVALETFVQGADGVLVIGCHPPDCHYVDGNLQAERKIEMVKRLISRAGLEPERLRLEWVYASEVKRFASIINDFRKRVIALGPSPLAGERPDKNLLLNLEAAKATAEDYRLRVLVGREKELIEEGNVFGEAISQQEFDQIMDEAINAEYLRNKIYLLTKKEPLSVKELSRRLDLDPRTVLRHIVVLRERRLITVDRVEETSPLYTILEVG